MNMNMLNGNFQIDRTEEIAPHLKTGTEKSGTSDVSFKDVLNGLVNQVDSLQKDADDSIQGLVTGETTNIHDVTIKLEEAEVAFELMMEIRSKLVNAYQQIMKMQV